MPPAKEASAPGKITDLPPKAKKCSSTFANRSKNFTRKLPQFVNGTEGRPPSLEVSADEPGPTRPAPTAHGRGIRHRRVAWLGCGHAADAAGYFSHARHSHDLC